MVRYFTETDEKVRFNSICNEERTMKNRVWLRSLLKQAGVSRYLLSRKEQKILLQFIKENEIIEGCTKGYYAGGRGLLIATNFRLLLLDSRLTSLYSRVVGYERLSDIKFTGRMLDSILKLRIDDKHIVFKSHNRNDLGRLSSYLRGKVLKNAEKEREQEYLSVLENSPFKDQGKILFPRHRHGKFPVTFQR